MSEITVPVTCKLCDETYDLIVPETGYQAWREGEHIQEALWMLPAGDRELLISGTCNACFDDLFPEEDADEYDDWVDGWADDDNGLSGGYYEDYYDSDLEWPDLF